MKHRLNPVFAITLFFGLLSSSMWSCQGAKQDPEADTIFEVKLTHKGQDSAHHFGFDVDLPRIGQEFHLMTGNIEVPFQLEDRNDNQIPDKLYGMIDLMPGYMYSITAKPGIPTMEIVPQVQTVAQLEDAQREINHHVYDDKDQWKHDGIILENNLSAYRLHMRPPFAIDMIGRRRGDLILDTLSGDLSTSRAWGGDLLDEGLSLGMGNLVICLIDEIFDLTSFDKREVTVTADGPLRSEVEVRISGIPVRNQKIDMRLNYVLQAGHYWMEVSAELLTKTDLNLQFAFGLPKHPEATPFTQGKRGKIHYAYTFGTQSAFGDHLGMGIFLKDVFEIDNFLTPTHDAFYLVKPKEGKVQYRMLYAWSGGRLAITDEVQFLDLLKNNVDAYQNEPLVEVTFHR